MSRIVDEHWKLFLVFGLFFTLLAGIGRYWDNPKAYLWQYLGLGSIIYVFVLSFILWALIYPLSPSKWSFRNVLLFTTLTSPPAILYAIPVERFLSQEMAVTANVWFLSIVALWRVALYVMFLYTTAKLKGFSLIVAALLPLTLIVFFLASLNLEHVVFELMGGIAEEDRSPNDGAYLTVFVLSMYSFIAAPILFLCYLVLIFTNQKNA